MTFVFARAVSGRLDHVLIVEDPAVRPRVRAICGVDPRKGWGFGRTWPARYDPGDVCEACRQDLANRGYTVTPTGLVRTSEVRP